MASTKVRRNAKSQRNEESSSKSAPVIAANKPKPTQTHNPVKQTIVQGVKEKAKDKPPDDVSSSLKYSEACSSNTSKMNLITLNTTTKNTTLLHPRASNPNMPLQVRVASEPINVRISKALAAVLRHGKMDVPIDSEGFAFVDDILAHPHFQKLELTVEGIRTLCNSPIDNVKRFQMIKDDVSRQLKIRAIYGHTVNVENLDLNPLSLDDTMHMPFVIHGTYWRAWEKIRYQGLKLMENRTHLFFQPGELGGGNKLKDLVQRFRNNCEVLVYVDLAKAIEAGIKFYRSTNNVVMTSGDYYGRIPSRFFLKAVHISPTTGDQIWIETLGNDDCIKGDQIIDGLEHRASASPETILKKIKAPNPFPVRSRNTSAVYEGKSRNTSENSGRNRIWSEGNSGGRRDSTSSRKDTSNRRDSSNYSSSRKDSTSSRKDSFSNRKDSSGQGRNVNVNTGYRSRNTSENPSKSNILVGAQ